MNPSTLAAQASKNAAQGQQMLSQDRTSAASYQKQYGTATNQAQAANKSLSSYTDYIKGAGNPLTLYNQGIAQGEQAQGFDPKVLAESTQNLTRMQNALGALSNASQSATGGYGLSGAQLGNFYATNAQPLQAGINAESNAVGNYQQLYQNALNQGQQGAALGVQGEQLTSQNLQSVAQNALAQQNNALSQMQFFKQLAQQQGSLNAQQYAAYQNAYNSYLASQAALQQAAAATTQANASAALAAAQTTGQNLTNQQIQAAMKASKSPKSSVGGVTSLLQGNPSSLQGGGLRLQ